jgi:hypothetical protein
MVCPEWDVAFSSLVGSGVKENESVYWKCHEMSEMSYQQSERFPKKAVMIYQGDLDPSTWCDVESHQRGLCREFGNTNFRSVARVML